MVEAQMVAGHWLVPTVESNDDGAVRLHVSVSVPAVEALEGHVVSVGVVAGGQELPARETPPEGSYYYLETISVTAVADFVFDNLEQLPVQQVTVALDGEQTTFEVEDPPRPSDFPVA